MDMDTVPQDDVFNLCDSEESSEPVGCEPDGDDSQFFDKSSTDSTSPSQSKKIFKKSKKRKLQISDFYDLEAKCRHETRENRLLDSESESMGGFIDDNEIIYGRQYYSYVDNNYFPKPKKQRTTKQS